MPQPHQRCENRFQSKKKIKRKYLCLNLTNNPTMQACGSSNHRVRRHQREEVDHSFQHTIQCNAVALTSYHIMILKHIPMQCSFLLFEKVCHYYYCYYYCFLLFFLLLFLSEKVCHASNR